MRKAATVTALVAVLVSLGMRTPAGQTVPAGSWLEAPLTNWNVPGAAVPAPPAAREPAGAVIKRCQLASPQGTAAERQLVAAGWIPFWHVDRQIVRGDVEIVGGMAAADGQCGPAGFNLFVFVDGRFAGTLSPAPMTAQKDGAAGAVRIAGRESITAALVRYRGDDPACCPSSHVTVRYRIDRQGDAPAVVPIELVRTRGN